MWWLGTKKKKKRHYPIAMSLDWSMSAESMSAVKEGRKEGGEGRREGKERSRTKQQTFRECKKES